MTIQSRISSDNKAFIVSNIIIIRKSVQIICDKYSMVELFQLSPARYGYVVIEGSVSWYSRCSDTLPHFILMALG